MQEINLAKAEVKALCHYAKANALELAQRSTRSNFTYPGQKSIAEIAKEEAARWTSKEAADFERWKGEDVDDMLGALDVFGILSVSLWGFSERRDYLDGVNQVRVRFSEVALSWLMGRRQRLQESLDRRRAGDEISGGTRNETFVLFALDTIAKQLEAAPDLKAAA